MVIPSGVSAVDSSKTNSNSAKISSLKDLEQHPEFFPLWMEQIQKNNMSQLLTATAPVNSDGTTDSGSSDGSSMFSSAGSSDPLSQLNGTNSADPLSGLFPNSGNSSLDLTSLMSPMPTLQDYEVQKTLQGLQDYSNLKETKSWLGQVVTYVDPTTNMIKTGTVTRVDIENVQKPTFRIDDQIDVSLDDLKALNADSSSSAGLQTKA
jgi:hypothetical protein